MRKLGLGEGASDELVGRVLVGVQRAHGLPGTGVPDGLTLDLLGPPADSAAVPDWYGEDSTRESMRCRFGLSEDELRRLEGQHGVFPGCGDGESLALLLEHWA